MHAGIIIDDGDDLRDQTGNILQQPLGLHRRTTSWWRMNVWGGFHCGTVENVWTFIDLYYSAIDLQVSVDFIFSLPFKSQGEQDFFVILWESLGWFESGSKYPLIDAWCCVLCSHPYSLGANVKTARSNQKNKTMYLITRNLMEINMLVFFCFPVFFIITNGF